MSPIKQFLSILALTAMWSPSFLFIKLGLQSLSPFGLVTFRVFLASLLLVGTLIMRRQPMPKEWDFWKHMTMMALLSSVVPFSLFGYAGKIIDSSTSAMINAMAPVFTILLSLFFIPSDRLSFLKVLGVLMSLFGLFWLLGPSNCFINEEMTLATLAACLATFSYGASHVYAKKFITGRAPFVAPAAQMIVSTLMLFPVVVFFEGHSQFVEATWLSFISVGCLALFGTFLAFSLYYRLLEHCGATSISMVACFFPIGSMILGSFFLGEVITFEKILAAALILTGGMIVNEVIVIKSAKENSI